MNTPSDSDQPAGDPSEPAPTASPAESSEDKQVPVPQPQAVRAALATLPPVEPAHDFWDEVDKDLQQGTPLHLSPRPAIRPITEPPPASGTPGTPIEDVFERGGHRGPAFGRRPGVLTGTAPGMSRKRLGILVAVAAVAVFLALGALLSESPDEPDLTTGDDPDAEAADTEGDEPAEGEEGDGAEDGSGEAAEGGQPETTGTTLPPEPESLGEDAQIQPGGVGLVRTGSSSLRDIGALSPVAPAINQGALNVSGGRCFDATMPGADDLTWWIASVTGEPLDNPEDGMVVAVSLGGVMSPRQTEDGFGLGTPGEELRTHYAGRLQTYSNPFNSQGAIYVVSAPDGSGMALAYWTDDDDNVAEIRAGHEQLLTRPDMCL